MTKKIKTSLVLSSLVLGTVSLSADIVITNNNSNGIYESSLDGKSIENKQNISSNVSIGNKEGKINAVKIDSAKSSTITNNGIIDLKAQNTGNNDLVLNGVAIGGDTGFYYDSVLDSEPLPSLKMIDLNIFNNKSITTSAKSNGLVETTGMMAFGLHQNNKIKNDSKISTYAESSDDALAAGVKLGDLLSSEVLNTGTIESTAKGDNISTAFGITSVSAENSTFVNKGTISTNAESKNGEAVSVATEYWGWNKNEEHSLINSKYTNDGTIKAVANGKELAEALGLIAADAPVKNNTNITNNGTIIAEAKSSKSAYSWGIATSNFSDSTVTNNGKITVTANSLLDANAEAIEFGDVYNSEIINNGTIEASLITGIKNDDDAAGIRTDTVENSKITNSGTITTNVNIAGSNSLSVGINPTELYNSTITNSGTIKSTIANKLDYKGMAIVVDDVENSTIINTSNGKIYGNVVFLESDAKSTFKNEGFISLPYNANKNAKFSSVSLQANIPNLVNSGTIEIGAFKDSKGNIENTQIKTTNATFEAGSKMQVAVVSGSKAFVLNDTLSEVVTASNKLTINELALNQTKLADNSATLDFEYKVLNDKQIDLVVSKVNSIKDIVTKPDTEQENKPTDNNKPNIDDKPTDTDKPNTENKPTDNSNNSINVNAGHIAAVLDDIRQNQDKYPTMGSVISKIDSLSSNQDVRKAVNSLAPISSTSLIKTSDVINSNISNIVSNRLNSIKSGLNSGDEMSIDNNKLWAKVYGSIGKQSNKDGIDGFDLKTYGLGMGYDKEYKDGQVLGLGAFYTNADIDMKNVNHKNDVDSYSVVAYGSNLLKDDKTTVYYQTSYSWQKNDSKRELFTGDKADAKFTSKTFAIESKVGHKIDINDKASIEPNVGIAYRHFKNPSYSENGAGSLNLNSKKFSDTELIGKIGADFNYKFTDSSKLTANLVAGYNFRKGNNKVTTSFEGANSITFDSKGIDNGRWKYEAGVGYTMDINSTNNLGVDYKFVGEGSKFRNNILSVNYNYKF